MGAFHGIPFDTPQALEAAERTLHHLLITRYTAAAGITLLLYDHMLTFGDEVKYIWKSKEWTAPKYMFFIVRYGVPLAVLGHIIQMSGLSNITLSDALPGILCCIGESQCQSDARFDPCLKHCNLQTAFGLTTIAMTNCTFAQHADADPLLGTQLNALSSESSVIVLLRLWVLWDRDRIAVAVTVFAFVLTNVVSLGMLIFMITRVYATVTWNQAILMCSPAERLPLGGLWIPGLVFEVIIFVMACFNALYRPRPSHDALAKVLYRDGLTYFAVLFTMRIINVVVGFVAPLSLIFVGVFFVWCTTTITTTRLVINIRKMSEAPDDDDDEPATPLPLTKSPSRKRRTPLPYDEQSIDDRGLGPRNSKFSEYSRSSVSEAAHHSNAVSSYSCSNFGSGNYGGRAAPPASRTTATGAFEHVEHIDLTPIRPRSIGGGGAWVEPKSWRRSESANGHHGRGHSERSFGDMSEEDGSVLDIGRFK
ncbi:hypothetical protein BDV98DRAFT_211393 [Pterulicium gracile]|uniref:DUF6533 domain-containing protein n=1 Tax=Pterulicium gracile TaxID=1884261 RepID=A0A5C3Q9E1_9AGAR|nr:hypothetical protein BDV98DRAFT_211393 [Pterula gracilis]